MTGRVNVSILRGMARKRDAVTGAFLPNPEKLAPQFVKELEDKKGGPVPAMTDALAVVYAKLLKVGCPGLRAVFYCCPNLTRDEKGLDVAKQTLRLWNADALVLEALENINGGKYHELPEETRLRIAIEKSNAEAAFYLYANNFNDMESRDQLEKVKLARDIVKAILGQQPDQDDPMAAFARLALELTRNTQATAAAKVKKPPQLATDDGLDKIMEKMPKRTM